MPCETQVISREFEASHLRILVHVLCSSAYNRLPILALARRKEQGFPDQSFLGYTWTEINYSV